MPSALTLITVPLYLEVVGVERYGILALCWVIVSYSGFLDLGLAPATTQRMAAARTNGDDVEKIFWTSVWLSLLAGLGGAAAVHFGAAFYFGSMAEVDNAFQNEIAEAIPLVAMVVPLTMLGSVLAGAIQARERFLALNALWAVGNILITLLPLLLAYLWAPTLSALIAGSLVGRFVPLPFLYWVCHRAVPLNRPRALSFRTAKNLLGFGSWMSLTALTNGVLGTIDRLAIGSTLGAAAVSAYTIPYSLISRVILIPHSLGPALFPRFASVDPAERRRLLLASIEAVAVIVTPLSIGLVAVTEVFFTLWIGASLTVIAAPLAYAFATGFWIYCIGYPAFSMIQASGQPRRVLKVLVAELLPYLLLLVIAMQTAGLIGAAVVLSLRYAAESLVVLRLAGIPLSSMRFLLAPAALTLTAAVAAAGISGLLRYVVLGALLIGALIWSAFHIPEVLRPYVNKLLAILRLPKRGASGTG